VGAEPAGRTIRRPAFRQTNSLVKVKLAMLKAISRAAVARPRPGPKQSWSLVTLHKAGSSYVAGMIGKIFASNGYEKVDLCNEAFRKGIGEVEYVSAHKSEITGDG